MVVAPGQAAPGGGSPFGGTPCAGNWPASRRPSPGSSAEAVAAVMDAGEQALWLALAPRRPHGVRRMSQTLAGVVETSNNLGMVELQPDGGRCNFMVRSLRDSGSDALADEIGALFPYRAPGPNSQAATRAGHPTPPRRCWPAARPSIGGSSEKNPGSGHPCRPRMRPHRHKYPGLDIVSFGLPSVVPTPRARPWRSPRWALLAAAHGHSGGAAVEPEDLQRLVSVAMPYGRYKGRLIADLPETTSTGSPGRAFRPARSAGSLALMREIDHNGLSSLLTPLRRPGWGVAASARATARAWALAATTRLRPLLAW